MKALEFETRVNPDQTLTVPAELAQELPAERAIRVLLLVPESAEEEEWERLTAEEFLKGYGEGDSVYDQLPAG